MARAVCATKVRRLVARGTLLRGEQKKMTKRSGSFFLRAAAKGGARGGKAVIACCHCNKCTIYCIMILDFDLLLPYILAAP